ncbi:hypothetical protein GF325_06915 [Candidatus Bathyarchaeota archaeon]|nr:hypothetical protein [Candidatus Bathyarchaeota archaeon]
MEFFDCVKDIESLHKRVLENAVETNSRRIDAFRVEQENEINKILSDEQKVIEKATLSLKKDIGIAMRRFRKMFTSILEEFNRKFEKERGQMEQKLMQHLGFDF